MTVSSLLSASPERRHDLDALHASAMLLGVVLHAATAYTPLPWALHDTSQSETLNVLFYVIHGFRMPLFFLISGYFTALLWQKYGISALVRHRAKRILLPFILAMLTILPLTEATRDLVSHHSGSETELRIVEPETVDGAQPQDAAENYDENVLELAPRLDRSQSWIEQQMHTPVLFHLWFLWHLCWLVLGFAVVVSLVGRWPWRVVPDGLLTSPVCYLWLVPLTMIPQSAMNLHGLNPGFGPDTSAGTIPIPRVLGYYALFFSVGALMQGQPTRVLGRFWWGPLALALGVVLPLGLEFSVNGASLCGNPTAGRWAGFACKRFMRGS